MSFNDLISAIGPVLPDNTSVALDIESTDAKDYITLQTTDSDERIILSQELTVPDGSINNPSIRFTGHNTGIHNDSGHIAAVLQGSRTYKLGSAHFQRYDVSRGFEIDTAAGTTTNPVYAFNGDTDTGVGTGVGDQLSLIAGGVEGIRITEAVTHASGSIASAVVKIQDAIQYNSGTGSDTATTEAVYLEDTNSHLVIDFANGNFGDVTLAAAIDTVKFLNAPPDGTVATVTAKITQDSSNREIDYSASAVTVYSEDGDTAVTGEVLWSGAAAHVMSTGSGAVDLVSFTCIPSGSTFNIYAAVIGQAFA